MADTTTTTYGLTKPEVGASEDTWGDKLNTNLDSLDDLLDGTTLLQGPRTNDSFQIRNGADTTKVAAFSAGTIATGTTRTFTFPDLTGTLIVSTGSQTLSNKTLASPVVTGNLTFDGVAHTGTTGTDTKLVSGTAGTSGNVVTWDANGDAVDGGRKVSAYEFISSQDASASATLDFTGFDATKYDSYVFELMSLVPSIDNVSFIIRTSTDGGSTYDSGASDYTYLLHRQTNDGAATIANTGGSASRVFAALLVGNAAGEDGVSATVTVHGPHLAKRTMFDVVGSYHNASGQFVMARCAGVRASSADVDAIRFLFESGNIASGTITMYGLRNS